MDIRRYDENQYAELVAFVARLNPLPAYHIGYFGADTPAIRSALSEFSLPLTECFWLAHDGKRLVGVLGVDVDLELGRAWLYGPLVEQPNADAIADSLFAVLRPTVPVAVQEYELFCDSANVTCQSFAARHAFLFYTEAAILFFTRNQLPNLPMMSLPELRPQDLAAFDALHNRLFPRTYASAPQLFARQDEHEKIFAVVEGDTLLGYAAVKVEPASEAGYTEYIGVAESARGRGVGRQLLATALHWMFSFPDVQRVDLTVETENVAAMRLYQSLGFQQERLMQAYRTTSAPV